MKKILLIASLIIATLLSTGCSSRGYAQSSVGQNMQVEPGLVQSVKKVIIDSRGTGNALGGIVGSVAGAAAGAHVGGGTGKIVASVLGATLGSVAGGTIGNQLDTNYGQEVIVKLNNGRTVATVLRINESTPALIPGQAVNVFISSGKISNISAR